MPRPRLPRPRFPWILTVLFALMLTGCPKKPQSIDEQEVFWPAPPDEPVIKWEGHIATSRWAENPSTFRKFLLKLAGRVDVTHFKKPYDVTTDLQGRVYVSDTGWGRVLVFDQANRKFRFLGDGGQGNLEKPAGVATDSRGHVFVADLKLARVNEYDENFEFVRAYAGGRANRPVGVAVDDARQHLWIVDSQNHNVLIYGMDGELIATVGERGSDPGQFNFPTNIAIGPSGDAYVVDTFNFRVEVFDPQGNFVRTWGENCDTFGCFARAKGIAVDQDEHVYVVDAAFNNVQMFDADGQLLLFFGGVGNGPGQLWLPAGITASHDRKIYVVSQYNWRVNVYDYLGAPKVAAQPPPAEPAVETPATAPAAETPTTTAPAGEIPPPGSPAQ